MRGNGMCWNCESRFGSVIVTNIDDVAKLIKKHEGYRNYIYLDTVGVPTGGYGHAFLPNSKLPIDIWEQIFNYDLANAVADFYSLKIFGLNHARKAVVVSMIYQLGLGNLLKFKRFLTNLRSGEWDKAAEEMIDSRWYTQTPNRVDELAQMMRDG